MDLWGLNSEKAFRERKVCRGLGVACNIVSNRDGDREVNVNNRYISREHKNI